MVWPSPNEVMSPDLSPISTEPRSSVTTRTANPADEIRAIRLNLARRAFLRQYFELTGAMESDSDKYVEAFRWRDKTALRALGVSFNTILGLTEVALAQQQATGSTPREPNPRQSERRQHYRAVMEAGVPVYLLHPKNFLEYGKQLNWDVKFTSTAVRQALSQYQIRRGMLTSMQLPVRENTCPG
ncbi:hypothetical protein LY78DRAFT_78601 [Colletotrichum sublineola]|nr:hypothetical protein LY78DRAFT_78601 [Colletotrichum sublineola]